MASLPPVLQLRLLAGAAIAGIFLSVLAVGPSLSGMERSLYRNPRTQFQFCKNPIPQIPVLHTHSSLNPPLQNLRKTSKGKKLYNRDLGIATIEMSHAMARIIRARAVTRLLSNPRPFSASAGKDPAEAAGVGTASSEGVIMGDQAAALSGMGTVGEQAAAGQPEMQEATTGEKKSGGFLMYGILAGLTGAIGAAGYYTYAYSLEEIEEKTRDFRKNAQKMSIPNDGSALQKFRASIYSGALAIPANMIEFYLDSRSKAEEEIKAFTEPSSDKLLPDLHPQEQGHVFTLVLDLHETLVYSDWERDRGWNTLKRPGVDAFLEHLAKFYEIVVYSDQLPMYVDPIMDRLDQKGCVRYRLSRPATKYINGKHYRDLSKLNRDPSRIIYVSGHGMELCLQPENCVPVKPFKLEGRKKENGQELDTALLDLVPFLEYVAMHRPADIRAVLQSYQGHDIAKEFIERSKEHQKRMQEQKRQGWLGRR